MTDWAAMLVPAGTLVAGSVLAMCGQGLVDRRALRREREARRDNFTVKRYELERDTLLAQQDALIRHMQICIFLASSDPKSADTHGDLVDVVEKIVMLNARTFDSDVRAAVKQYIQVAGAGDKTKNWSPERMKQFFSEAQNAIGSALRKDPFKV
jgi:hypothetical protein